MWLSAAAAAVTIIIIINITTIISSCSDRSIVVMLFNCKANLQPLAESTGVVIATCLGITKALQDGVGGEDEVFDPWQLGYLCAL
jgi:hypothetical protein